MSTVPDNYFFSVENVSYDLSKVTVRLYEKKDPNERYDRDTSRGLDSCQATKADIAATQKALWKAEEKRLASEAEVQRLRAVRDALTGQYEDIITAAPGEPVAKPVAAKKPKKWWQF